METSDGKTAMEVVNDILQRVEGYTGRDDRGTPEQATQDIERILSLKPDA